MIKKISHISICLLTAGFAYGACLGMQFSSATAIAVSFALFLLLLVTKN